MNLEVCFAYTLPGFPNLKEAKLHNERILKFALARYAKSVFHWQQGGGILVG